MHSPIFNLDTHWKDCTFVAFDTETSGQYPIVDELVEVGMVKYRNGEEIDRFQTLLKPTQPLTDFIIGIHGLTNELVADAPTIKEKVNEIHNFLNDSVVVAHHAPFDLGFLSWEFEKAGKPLPIEAALCTSLLSRNLIESPNHKLRTMVAHLGLKHEQAHRAESDARACWQLAVHCMNKVGANATLKEVIKAQGKTLNWHQYSIQSISQNQKWKGVVDALLQKKNVEFVYMSGSHKGKPRKAKPLGLVRNPDGDYFPALCFIDNAVKRFYLNKVTDSLICD